MSDFLAYHESVTAELNAVKNRIRSLVMHWQTDGEWKEASLRHVLRRHLPGSSVVCRGFIVGPGCSSTQIDLLVLRPEKPMLFSDGELAIVTPDVPAAIVEVKTGLAGQQDWCEAASKLALHADLCKTATRRAPWLGLFVYEGDASQAGHVLEVLRRVHRETGTAINCVTCGQDLFIRYWPPGECERGDAPPDSARRCWRAHDLQSLSLSYFVSNVVDAVCNVDRPGTYYAWFAHQGGKRPHMVQETWVEECEPAGVG